MTATEVRACPSCLGEATKPFGNARLRCATCKGVGRVELPVFPEWARCGGCGHLIKMTRDAGCPRCGNDTDITFEMEGSR